MSVALKVRAVVDVGMTRDKSLDEFAADSDRETEAGGSGGSASNDVEESVGDDVEESAGDDVEGVVSPGAVEPAVSTSSFVPEGAVCAVCETGVTRRFMEDGNAVCADCKTW